MFFKRKKNNGERKLIKAHLKLIEQFQEEITILETVIKDLKEKRGNYPDAFVVPNTLLFFRLSFLDIFILCKQYLETNKEFEKLILAKQISAATYELLDDLPTIYGKRFKTAIEGTENEKEILEGRVKLQKSLNTFKSEFSMELKEIRNFTIAHKDHDSLRQLEIINCISQNRIKVLIASIHIIWFAIMDFEKTIRKPIKEKLNDNA